MEAAKWWKLAAAQSHTETQNNLGVMYHKGEGVPQDDQEAVKWLRLAAAQGNAKAQQNPGVAQDHVQAHKWYNLLVESGTDTMPLYPPVNVCFAEKQLPALRS